MFILGCTNFCELKFYASIVHTVSILSQWNEECKKKGSQKQLFFDVFLTVFVFWILFYSLFFLLRFKLTKIHPLLRIWMVVCLTLSHFTNKLSFREQRERERENEGVTAFIRSVHSHLDLASISFSHSLTVFCSSRLIQHSFKLSLVYFSFLNIISAIIFPFLIHFCSLAQFTDFFTVLGKPGLHHSSVSLSFSRPILSLCPVLTLT